MKHTVLQRVWCLLVCMGSACAVACLTVPDNGEPEDTDTGCAECHHRIQDQEQQCDGCHGNPPTTGAHTAHLTAPQLGRPMACADCHVVPKTWFEEGHLNAIVEMVFAQGSLARGDGASPVFDGRQCQGVYCHGATLAGGAKSAPAWTGEKIACGDCHGAPPPDPHPASDKCEVCHAAAYEGGELRKDRHIDGKVDFKAEEGAP